MRQARGHYRAHKGRPDGGVEDSSTVSILYLILTCILFADILRIDFGQEGLKESISLQFYRRFITVDRRSHGKLSITANASVFPSLILVYKMCHKIQIEIVLILSQIVIALSKSTLSN